MNGIPPKSNRKPIWRCFWLTFLVVSLAYAWYSFYVPANDVAWAVDYAEARQQAMISGKPMVLYFTGKWCVPCRIMKRQVWANEQVAAAVNSKFIPLAIDVSNPNNASLLARYNVKGAPVSIVTDPEGNAIDWRAGRISKSEFLTFLQSSLSNAQ